MPSDLALPELLRKCHRAELEPLAATLRIDSPSLGFAKLCETIDVRLRRSGGHALQNLILRRGEGPPYGDVLGGLCRRKGLLVRTTTEDTEKALLADWLRTAWTTMSPNERSRTWARLEMPAPLPESPDEAVQRAEEDQGFGYRTGGLVAASAGRVVGFALVPFLGPFLAFLGMMWLFRPRDEVLLPAVLEISRLRQAVLHRVTIGVVGAPSSGKDAAIGAIFHMPTGNVNPIAGSTKDVSIVKLPGATALYIVNTPGMGDVTESVSEEARQVLAHIDVYLHIVNAQGGVQQREKDNHARCAASGRPVLVVVNKIDTLREADRERLIADCRKKLDVGPDDVVGAAFDPLPQLSASPLGVPAVRTWLRERLLELGKSEAELVVLSTDTDTAPTHETG